MAARKPAAKAAPKRNRPTAPAAKKKPATRAPDAPQPAVAPKPEKHAKVKLIRDSFTIPKTEYAALDDLKKRAARAGAPSKKSELLRAGLMVLASMDDASFQAAVRAVPQLKTGRPKKD